MANSDRRSRDQVSTSRGDTLPPHQSFLTTAQIERKVQRQVVSSNLSFRQLLSKNLVRIAALKVDIQQLKQGRFSWLNQRQARFKKRQISVLQSKNRYLRTSIAREQKREQLLGYLGATSAKTHNVLRSRLGLTNFRFFRAELQNYLSRYFIIDVLKVALGSLLVTIAFVYFLNATGLLGVLPSGASAVARLLADLPPDTEQSQRNSLFFLYYLLLNGPLVIFSFWKVGVRFACLSLFFMLFQNLYNLIIRSVWFLNTNYLQMLIDYARFTRTTTPNTEPDHLLWLFVFALGGALFSGVGGALVYRANGSTGGFDFLSGYLQKRKQVSIGRVNFFASTLIFLIVFLVKTLTISDRELQHYFNFPTDFARTHYQIRFFFGPSLFASLLYIFALTGVLNSLYPKYRYLLVSVKTTHPFDVMAALRYRGFNSDIQKSTKTAFNADHPQGTSNYYLELHCSMVDLKETKTVIFLVDEQATIATTRIHSFRGSKLIDAFRR